MSVEKPESPLVIDAKKTAERAKKTSDSAHKKCMEELRELMGAPTPIEKTGPPALVVPPRPVTYDDDMDEELYGTSGLGPWKVPPKSEYGVTGISTAEEDLVLSADGKVVTESPIVIQADGKEVDVAGAIVAMSNRLHLLEEAFMQIETVLRGISSAVEDPGASAAYLITDLAAVVSTLNAGIHELGLEETIRYVEKGKEEAKKRAARKDEKEKERAGPKEEIPRDDLTYE